MTPQQLTEWVVEQVENNPLLKVIYFQAVDALSLQQVENWADSERIQGCIAVQTGEIRLIDNIKLK
jgi:pantoate--beta-alanine ligase